MFWGILIAIVLTALVTILVLNLNSDKQPGPLSYIVIVVALVALCIEGVALFRAIDTKRNTDETVALIEDAILTAIGSDASSYRIGIGEATAAKFGLRLVYPSVARYFEPADLAGHTVSESADVLRRSIERSTSHRIWMSVLWMVITLVLSALLLALTLGIGGSGGGRGGRGSRSGRVAVHGRAPRSSHRGRRR